MKNAPAERPGRRATEGMVAWKKTSADPMGGAREEEVRQGAINRSMKP